MNFLYVVEMQFITLMLLIFFLQIGKKMELNLTPTSGQDSTSNSHYIKSKIDPTWEDVSEEMCLNGRKALICMYFKKVTKGRGIHRMKQHLARVKGDIGPCIDQFLPVLNTKWRIPYRRL